ncbi:MAG: DUF3592 domain-containing protein [Gemmatimonadetes bacterium]|nr:DUF3592 domain-containing protein [Gemmatimonadota bacterium]
MSDLMPVRHLAPPPRRVPLALSIRVVLGGMLGQLGWFLVGFGFIFVWAFDASGGVMSAIRFSRELATVEGTTTSWRELNLSINDEQVYETSYSFEVGGQTFEGVSYATGHYESEGQRLPVEYRASDRTISRLQGMRGSTAGLMIAFVFLIPLIGLAFVRSGLISGLRARRLLAEGQLALGTLKSDEPTNVQVNNQPVRRLRFEFTAADGGTYSVFADTHHASELMDDGQERLVYDPRHPRDAVLIDDLPGRPRIDARGNFEAGGAREVVLALLNLVIPAVTIVGHGLFSYFYR